MTVIRIKEVENSGMAEGSGEMRVVVEFDHGVEYEARVRDPFGEEVEKEGELEWYFERYLEFPFPSNEVRKEHAVASIQGYGEGLFGQVFGDARALEAYRRARDEEGVSKLQVEIAGSVGFQRLHWEALYDGELGVYLALKGGMTRRQVKPPRVKVAMKPFDRVRVLVVVARPEGRLDAGYRTISRPLVEMVADRHLPVEVTLLRPGTYMALKRHLEMVGRDAKRGVGYYQVVHFDMHGGLLSYEDFVKISEGKGAQQEKDGQANKVVYKVRRPGRKEIAAYEGEKAFLSLEREEGVGADLVEAEEIAQLLIEQQVPIAVLNACQSAKTVGGTDSSLGSRLVEAGVQTVVAMGYSITVSAAERLMRSFYKELFEREQLGEALSVARQALADEKERAAYYNQMIELEDWLLPIVYQNQDVPLKPQKMEWSREKEFYRSRSGVYKAKSGPSYGFVGRDLDILQIEKRLLAKRNVLLVRGMGGAGKTTLLQHLAGWWQQTGLVQKVFYFGYDEKAWTRQQMMDTIAKGVLGEEEWQRSFRLLKTPEDKQIRLGQVLKSERHLIMMDNLESITGSALAIQHTLAQKEQERLRALLVELVGGETLVVLGSRGGEEWLAKGTFEENVYDLAGLDAEAASVLAEKILERHKATKYRGQKKLQELIRLLDGFPLALQVVLANLERQTPEQILEALQVGGVDLNVGSSQARTENILRCIDYSYSNLAGEVQELLLCLAPFTSVVRIDTLEAYAERLKKQEALADLPFEQWQRVIEEAIHWGLLTPDENISLYAHMQPTLPYFLRNRLADEAQKERRRAIEQAFYEYYIEMSGAINALINSKEAQKQQVGFVLAQFEYENVMHALRFAVRERVSLNSLYFVLSDYLNRRQDFERGRELDKLVLAMLERLSDEERTGPLGEEYVRVLHTAANRQLALKHYEVAKELYQRVLQLVEGDGFERQMRLSAQAVTYHQLGVVAQEERKWEEASEDFVLALQIFAKYKDEYSGGVVFGSLKRLWGECEDEGVRERIAEGLEMTMEEAREAFEG